MPDNERRTNLETFKNRNMTMSGSWNVRSNLVLSMDRRRQNINTGALHKISLLVLREIGTASHELIGI